MIFFKKYMYLLSLRLHFLIRNYLKSLKLHGWHLKLKYLFLKLKLFGICLKLQVLLLYGKDMRRVKETKSQFCPMFTLLPKRGSCLDGHVNSCFQIIMIVMFTMQLCMFAANCQHSSIFFIPFMAVVAVAR